MTSSMSCSTTTIVSPLSSRSRRITAIKVCVSVGLSPPAGSSSRSSRGSEASARAISSRFWAPSGRLPASVSAAPASPKRASSAWATAR